MFIQERSISREEIERERETFLFKKYLSMRERERERERERDLSMLGGNTKLARNNFALLGTQQWI